MGRKEDGRKGRWRREEEKGEGGREQGDKRRKEEEEGGGLNKKVVSLTSFLSLSLGFSSVGGVWLLYLHRHLLTGASSNRTP